MRKYCWDVPGMRLSDMAGLSLGGRNGIDRGSALGDEGRRHDGVGVAVHAVEQPERVVVLREEPLAEVEHDLADGAPGEQLIEERLGPLACEQPRSLALGADHATRTLREEVRNEAVVEV